MMTESSPDISNAKKSLIKAQPLEGYCILREIGHGTQGRVFLAERESDHTHVAIKRLDIESVKNWKEYELFHREVQVLEKLDIDGVARFWDAIECLDADPPCSYLVQEYIPGRSLNEMLRAGHHFSLDRVYLIVIQLLEILRQLQAYDPPVIHRDIKPSNIMLKPLEGDQYKVYLIDFGAVANPQVQSGGSTVAGTFGYMPPEQLMGKPIPASDIYSLASVAVYMLCGVSPADMPTKDFYLIFEPYLQNMPHALVQTLRQMLEPDTEKRLCNIEQLISTFNSFKDGQYANYTTIDHNDATYNARLKEVTNYCENGNIDLWQQLPEEKPRSIPLSYITVLRESMSLKMNPNLDENANRIPKSFDTLSKDKSAAVGEPVNGKKIIVEVPFVEFIGNIILFVIGLFVALFSSDKNSIIWGGGIILFAVISFVIHILVLKSKYRKQFSSMDELSVDAIDYSTNGDMVNPETNQKRSLPINPVKSFENLIRFGRKTIATIVSVEYIPVGVEGVCTHKLQKNKCNYEVRYTPTFLLKYKFNPPDDESEFDLMHSVYMHIEPNRACSAGAPLPILYRIYKDETGEHVDSMPFPLPLEQVEFWEDMMYLN